MDLAVEDFTIGALGRGLHVGSPSNPFHPGRLRREWPSHGRELHLADTVAMFYEDGTAMLYSDGTAISYHDLRFLLVAGGPAHLNCGRPRRAYITQEPRRVTD